MATATSLKTNVEDYIAVTGNFPDPASKAIEFSLGSVAYSDVTNAAGTILATPGTILATLSGGVASNQTISLTRTEEGVWTCKNSLNGTIDINGCTD